MPPKITQESPMKICALRVLCCLALFAGFGCLSGDTDASVDAPDGQTPLGGGALLDGVAGEVSLLADGGVGPGGPGFQPACAESADCDEEALCDCTGTCRAPAGGPCEQDKNCGSGTWCDPCSGHCEQIADLCEPCTQSGACGYDGACVPLASGGSFCALSCLTDAGCPVGFWCVEVEGIDTDQCVPQSGSCTALGLCGDDGDCPDNEICNESLKQCAQGCAEDGQCPQGQVCTAGRCGAPCASDGDCVAPAICEDDGHCKIPGACESSAECEPAHYCDKLEGACVPGCLVDPDCQDPALVCEGAQCVPKGCTHNYQCAFGQECDSSTGACVPTPDPHCSSCDAGAEDAAAACGGEPNLCVSLQDKDEVEKGDFCFLLCADDPVDTCPMGYGCIHIQTDDGSIDDYYCTRECWVDPVGASAQ